MGVFFQHLSGGGLIREWGLNRDGGFNSVKYQKNDDDCLVIRPTEEFLESWPNNHWNCGALQECCTVEYVIGSFIKSGNRISAKSDSCFPGTVVDFFFL